ncbi:VOC family protein [Vibrio vulnificus]|uniref:VOC family protein n=1 Tax=Vibrio vulnificus TaxID=672 RepID=UPI000CD06F0C|nr:VOC family protein [Vibrio vulnificus]POB85739.1 glyoxalase [Vibrio vulnificus]
MNSHYILYVSNQEQSSRFYENVLGIKPVLEVPGMTEFQLSNQCKLGLMPYVGIRKLLGEDISCPVSASKNPNSELYLLVDNPTEYHQRSLDNGAVELSGVRMMDWGHVVGYSKDLDGHILAFAAAC